MGVDDEGGTSDVGQVGQGSGAGVVVVFAGKTVNRGGISAVKRTQRQAALRRLWDFFKQGVQKIRGVQQPRQTAF